MSARWLARVLPLGLVVLTLGVAGAGAGPAGSRAGAGGARLGEGGSGQVASPGTSPEAPSHPVGPSGPLVPTAASGAAAPAPTSPASAAAPTPPGSSPTPSPVSSQSLAFPIRAAFFYPWYPESWYPQSHFTPTLGAPYNSSSPGVIGYQIAAMEYAHIQLGIASWWGQGTTTDQRIPLLLSAATGTGLRWALYYEPAPGSQASDLAYIYSHYAANSDYARVDGRPVLFVYSRSVADCAQAASWVGLNAGRFYLDLQVFSGYRSCPVQPDEWHQYAPAEREDHQAGHSFTVSPGFWLYSSSTPELARDPLAFAQVVQEMVASDEPWQLITTWNEWGEGTAVEDALQWQSGDGYGQYVDILHQYG